MADRTFLDWPFFDAGHRRLAEALEAGARPSLTGRPAGMSTRRVEHWFEIGRWRLASILRAGRLWRRARTARRPFARLIRETLARHSGLADFAFAMQGLVSGAIGLFGSEEQKGPICPPWAAGEKSRPSR